MSTLSMTHDNAGRWLWSDEAGAPVAGYAATEAAEPLHPPPAKTESNANSDAELSSLVLEALDDSASFLDASWEEISHCPFQEADESTPLAIFLRACKYYTRPRAGDAVAIDVRVDAAPIFERECYEAWLNSRTRALKNAPDSYRKTITSHCCRTDGRKPFPPPVEAAVLVQIRKPGVWPCFAGEQLDALGRPVSIGQQGFRSRGFHEQRAGDLAAPSAQIAAAASDECAGAEESAKRPRPAAASAAPALAGSARAERAAISANILEWAHNRSLVLLALERLGVRPRDFAFSGESAADSNDPFTLDMAMRLLQRDAVPWTFGAASVMVLTRCLRPHHLLSLMATSALAEHAEIFAEGAGGLGLAVDDMRLSQQFMFPEGLQLLPDAPTGRCVLCLNTFVWVSEDKVSSEIAGGSMAGSFAQKFAYPAALSAALVHTMPRLIRHGHVLWQFWAKSPEGAPMIMRSQYRLADDHKIHVKWQNVMALYPELLELPPLDDAVQLHAGAPVSAELRRASVAIGAECMRILNT